MPIQDFYDRLQRIQYGKQHIRANHDRDVDYAHALLINNGYTDDNEESVNVPYIKMMFKGPSVIPFTRLRRTRRAIGPRINYAKVFVFASYLPDTLRHQASFPEAKYLFFER